VTEYLSAKGIDFEEIDIRRDPDAIRELSALGIMATPALVMGAKILVGFDPAEIDRVVASMQ
jgi:glutaredoxin